MMNVKNMKNTSTCIDRNNVSALGAASKVLFVLPLNSNHFLPDSYGQQISDVSEIQSCVCS